MNLRPLLNLLTLACLINTAEALAEAPSSRVAGPIDDSRIVSLAVDGSRVTPLITARGSDEGALADGMPLNRMLIVLQRSPQQEAELKRLIDAQQDKSSPDYHRWLTPQGFGRLFGPSDHDLTALAGWLASRGFSGIQVNAGRTLVEFSGTAGAVRSAFHTTVHRYLVRGKDRYSAVSAPQIPAALAPIVFGFASLDNFGRAAAPVHIDRGLSGSTVGSGYVTAQPAPSPSYTTSSSAGTVYAVTPYDLAAIYNVTPLWNGNIDGTGQTIAVVGQSDINAADFVSFRKLFGLPIGDTSSATHTQYLDLIYNGPNPGINQDEMRGDADTQWAGAVAKDATIDYVASASTEVTLGSDLSAAYIVDNNLAPVLVDSFSRCERDAGAGYNSFINGLWQQAAAQGITVVVAAGDGGSAACEAPSAGAASSGLAVNAIASTPYNVAVGGTDFYMPAGGSAYWNASNDPTTAASAKGYIPETTWNDSCANTNFAAISPYSGETPEQVCNNSAAFNAGLLNVRAGGGGASSCAQSSGSYCSGYAKPSWQSGAGVPADQVRDLPDVSLFAGDGSFSSLYFLCQQSALPSGSTCGLGVPGVNFTGAGGTSFSSAAFAGVVALIDQKTGTRQGNVNYTLYNLAQQQTKAGTSCGATGTPATSCIFNDITTDNNTVPCIAGSPGCNTSTPGDTYGVLSGYSSTSGYDLATGLGSVNAANLVNGWSSAVYTATTTTLALSTTSVVHGSPVTATVAVTSSGGTPTGQVSINASATNGSIGDGTLTTGTFTGTYRTFPGGSYPVHAYYGGDGTFAASESVPVNLTVTAEPSTTTETVLDQNAQAVSSVVYGDILTLRTDVGGVSGQGTATGNVNVTDNGTVLYGGVYRLNSSGYTEVRSNSLAVGSHSFVASYVGDPSFEPSNSSADSLTITKAPTSSTVSPSTTSVSDADTITFSIRVGTTGYGYAAPSGTVTLTDGSQTLGQSNVVSGSSSGSSFDYSTATVTVPANELPNGTSQVTVTYSGDLNYLPSSGNSASIAVTSSGFPSTSTTLSVMPAVVASNGTITLTASVTPVGPGLAGNVQFAVDGSNIGTGVNLTSGMASKQLSATLFAPGMHTAQAVYSGDSSHKSSISSAVPFTVSAATGMSISNTAITVTPTSVTQGTAIVVGISVSPTTPAASGTAQILVDGNFFGSPVALSSTGTGSFTLVTSTLQPGTHTVSAYYGGDSNYAASFSMPTAFMVFAPGDFPTAVTLQDVPPMVGLGVTFSFSASITPTSPPPTGSFEVIVDNGTPQPQVTLQGNPQTLSLNTTGLSLGNHTVSVYYSGDMTYSAATSPPVTFTVVPANSRFTLTPPVASVLIPIGASSSQGTVFTINAAAGDAFPVAFACTSGLPAGVICSFSPSTVNVNGTGTTTLTLEIQHLSENRAPRFQRWNSVAGGISIAGLLLILVPRRRRGQLWIVVLLAFLAMGTMSGCGVSIRPALGPYGVVVTATSGPSVLGITTKTATVNLTIGGRL